MSPPIKLSSTLVLLAAIALLSLGLIRGISSGLHVPAAEILVAECQGFEALATAGGKHLTCAADVAGLNEVAGPDAGPAPAGAPEPAGSVTAPTPLHKKA